VTVGPDIPSKFVLLPFSASPGALMEAHDRFANDPAVKAAEFSNAPATAPSCLRVESSLLRAFSTIPELEVPPATPRIFEFRYYDRAMRRRIEPRWRCSTPARSPSSAAPV